MDNPFDFPPCPPLHPACAAYRRVTDDALQALALSIQTLGQRQPCVMHNGQMLDGKNRWEACGIAHSALTPHIPLTREFGSDPTDGTDPVLFVLSSNLRREQSEVEKAFAAAKMATLLNGSNRFEYQTDRVGVSEETPTSDTLSREEAAKMLAVNVTALTRARAVLTYAPELEEKIYDKNDKMTLTAAAAKAWQRSPDGKAARAEKRRQQPQQPSVRRRPGAKKRNQQPERLGAPRRTARAAHPMPELSREEIGRPPLDIARQQAEGYPEGWTNDMAHTYRHGQVQTHSVDAAQRIADRKICVMYWASAREMQEVGSTILERWLRLSDAARRDLPLNSLQKVYADLGEIIAGIETVPNQDAAEEEGAAEERQTGASPPPADQSASL